MWKRFADRARRVMFYAQEEAGRLGEDAVATEHLLLGLIRDEDNVASQLLKRMSIDLQQLHDEVARNATPGVGKAVQDIKLTPHCQRAIDLSYDEARLLDNNYIGTEHLLIGLIREGDGIAGRILSDLGVDLELTRYEVRKLQTDATQQSAAPAPNFNEHATDRLKRNREFWVTEVKGKPHRFQGAPTEDGDELMPGRGHIGILRNDNARQWVEFVPNGRDLPAFMEAMLLKDEFAYRELVTEGKVVLLAAGTGAKFLLMEKSGIACVRILDGDHAGKTGFVPGRQIKDTRPDDRPFPPEIR